MTCYCVFFIDLLTLWCHLDGEDAAEGGEQKKRQKRGGKGIVKTKKKETGPRGVSVSRASRGKKKYTTVVTGLGTYGKSEIKNKCREYHMTVRSPHLTFRYNVTINYKVKKRYAMFCENIPQRKNKYILLGDKNHFII